MDNPAALILLVAGLVLPVVIFWHFGKQTRLGVPMAAGMAIALGWATNIGWATVAGEWTSIAVRFGWVCPALLVLLTGLGQRFVAPGTR